jgi:hypothetical protein
MKLVGACLVTAFVFPTFACRDLANEPFVENNRTFIWAEVPDALGNPEPGNSEVELEPWAVNLNSITRHGDVVVFEGVSPEAVYMRFQGNCGTQEMKTLHVGEFLSSTSITYRYAYDEWSLAEGWQLALLDFVCAE